MGSMSRSSARAWIILALFAALTRGAAAQPVRPGADAWRERSRRRRHERQRPGSRRLGHCRDRGPADQVREDRRDRRARPLRPPRSAEGDLQRLGSRLRARRLGEIANRARDRSSISMPWSRRTRPRRRNIIPAIYWYAMLKIPPAREFTEAASQSGMPAHLKSQAQWLDVVKTNGCYGCHALGNRATRTIPKEFGTFPSSVEAWERRIQSGQAMTQMTTNIGRLHTKRALTLYADWTDRIAAGELPKAKPSRPQGAERNVVVTHVGLGRPEGLPPRRDLDRPAQSHASTPTGRSTARRRKAPIFCRCSIPCPHGVAAQDAGARSEDAVVERPSDGALALLGRRADLGQPDDHPQSDDG